MTFYDTTYLPDFDERTEETRRISAQILFEYLDSLYPEKAGYDGDRQVILGNIRVRYLTRAVEISFPDPIASFDKPGKTVAVYVPGTFTFGAVARVVEGLLAGPGVTL